MTEIVSITVEPDWCMVYFDGELFRDGHQYDNEGFIIDAVNKSDEACNIETEHIHPTQWAGVPDTLEEAEDTYSIDL